MTDQPSGIDLARIALANARTAARAAPAAAPKSRPSPRTSGRGDPIGVAVALERLVHDRGWESATAGGSILARWSTIAPELAGKVTAEHYDPDTGTLHLRPHVDVYGTHLRLREREFVYRINAAAGSTPVRALRVLPTRPATTTAAGHETQPAVTPRAGIPAPAQRTLREGLQQARAALAAGRSAERPAPPPSRTRESASDGYKRTRAVYLNNRRNLGRRNEP